MGGSAFAIEIALRKTEMTPSTLGSADTPATGHSLDFTKITLEATLLYDCDKEDRPVVQVRSRPLTTRGLVNPKSPSACRLETVVEALSSRHEDMSFKIKLAAVDMTTKKEDHGHSTSLHRAIPGDFQTRCALEKEAKEPQA